MWERFANKETTSLYAGGCQCCVHVIQVTYSSLPPQYSALRREMQCYALIGLQGKVCEVKIRFGSTNAIDVLPVTGSINCIQSAFVLLLGYNPFGSGTEPFAPFCGCDQLVP